MIPPYEMKAMAIIYSFRDVIASAFQRSNLLKLKDHFGKKRLVMTATLNKSTFNFEHFNQEMKP
jgi:hypothetical protein